MENSQQSAPVAPIAQSVELVAVAKPAPVAASQTRAATPKLAYRMLQGFRPQGGEYLFAHTAAFLQLSGMRAGRKVSAELMRAVMGPTAYNHHVNANNPRWTGFMLQDANGIELSYGGKINRHWLEANPEFIAAFVDILSTGKTARDIPAAFKNPLGIKTIG